MHKLKNKHTGEVITTPYLAEVEEYLNSGDYEMSDNKYPYIGEGKRTGNIVLFTSSSTGEVIVAGNSITDSYCEGYISDAWSEDSFKDITSEYLLSGYGKTYGKCESQEHADFICDLAKNAGFKLNLDFSEGDYFYFCGVDSYGFGCEKLCSNSARLITLPLPKKESKMPEEKPVYTKEMHERGELPPVGSFVETTRVGKVLYDDFFPSSHTIIDLWGSGCMCEVICHTKISGRLLPVVKHKEQVSAVMIAFIKPITTIEDELIKFLRETPHLHPEARARKMLELYNITPK